MEDIEPEEGNAFEEQSFQHHFRKPTKIHGRSREIDQIVRAYQLVKQKETEPKSHLILISGPAGCGKTALATVLREVVEKDDGFFMSWDSDQSHNLSIGGGFDKCFLDFRRDVLSRGSEAVEYVRSRFAAELDATEMMGVEQLVPAFKEFLPTNRDKSLPSEIETSGIHNKTFRAFFRAMGNHNRPLVQVFNNCQWADANAIHYWTTLLDNAEGETQAVLFVATCNTQDEDRSPYWNLAKQILFESDQIELTTIELSDLPREDFQDMMSDALRAPLESIDASFLASGYETTKGNPRFALELLHDNCVEEVEGVWISKAPPDSWQNGSLESWLLSRIHSQPEHLQQVLQVCSCFGIRFKADDINTGCSADVSDMLQELIDLGFLICLGRGKYQFANNSIQGAAYNSFQDEARRSAKHFSIGSRLVRFHVQQGTLENNLVMTTGQLLLGIDNVDTYDEKLAVARLCQRAALRCIALKSFHGAWKCLDSAIRLLDCEERRIWRDEYELALTLHNMASEVSYARGHNEDAEDLTKVIMAHARSFNDQLVAISTNLCVFGATKRPSEALELGLETLDKLGEKFPKKPTIRHVAREFHLTWRALRGKSKEALLRLPTLTDKSVAERLTLMNLVFPVAFRLMSKFMPLFAFRCVRLSLKYGVNAISSMGFAIVGLQFCSHIGRYDLGYEFGQVALGLLNRFTAKALTSRVQMVVCGCIHGFTRPLRLAVAPLKQAYWAGLESGDIEVGHVGSNREIVTGLLLTGEKVRNSEHWFVQRHQDGTRSSAEESVQCKLESGPRTCLCPARNDAIGTQVSS